MHGRITEVVGMLIKAVVPQVKMGEVVMIKRDGGEPLMAEVVGFTREEVYLSPLGKCRELGPSSEVIPCACRCTSKWALSFSDGS